MPTGDPGLSDIIFSCLLLLLLLLYSSKEKVDWRGKTNAIIPRLVKLQNRVVVQTLTRASSSSVLLK